MFRRLLPFLLTVIAVMLAALVPWTGPASAQSGTRNAPGSGSRSYPGRTYPTYPFRGRSESLGSGNRVVREKTFEEKFWDYLQDARYKNWAPVPGQGAGSYEGQSPHGAFLKMYLSRSAAGSPADLPDRAVVVKENYGPDGKTLTAITVMYRVKGYNPTAGDWYWVKYAPDGRVEHEQTPAGPVSLAGKVNGCIDCHAGADGGDFAFFNDEL